jgi:Tol biopolymer transport system component
MKNFEKKCLAILAVVSCLGCSRQAPRSLIASLAQLQLQKRIAIGYIYDRKLSVVEPGTSAQIHEYTIPGPGFYAVSLGPSGSLYGVSRQNENEFIALRPSGQIRWRRPGLYAEEDPSVSPDGTKVAFNGRDKESHLKGLLLVEDEGTTIRVLSREGSGPSWSPDGSRLCYQQGQEILIYDLKNKNSNSIAKGTDPRWSPNGKLISFRTKENSFSLMDSRGSVQRTLLGARNISTPLSWSPDSEYLMYVKTGGYLHGLACSDASMEIIVLRLSDGLTGSLLETCNTISPKSFRWLQIPSNLPL